MNKLHIGVYIIFVIIFGLLAYFAHRLPYFPGDISISLWLQRVNLPFFRPVMENITNIASTVPMAIIVAMVAGLHWAFRRRLEPIFIIALPLTAWGLELLIKLLVGRPRPSGELVQVLVPVSNNSFPSGHALQVVGFLWLSFLSGTEID